MTKNNEEVVPFEIPTLPRTSMINVDLLRTLQWHFALFPGELDMSRWWTEIACGTVGCIAGHAVMYAGRGEEASRLGYGWVFDRLGREVLGLSREQADRLFTSPFSPTASEWSPTWPDPYRRRYCAATSDFERAIVTIDRIDHFIETDGRE